MVTAVWFSGTVGETTFWCVADGLNGKDGRFRGAELQGSLWRVVAARDGPRAWIRGREHITVSTTIAHA